MCALNVPPPPPSLLGESGWRSAICRYCGTESYWNPGHACPSCGAPLVPRPPTPSRPQNTGDWEHPAADNTRDAG